jgi:hypothetical protein
MVWAPDGGAPASGAAITENPTTEMEGVCITGMNSVSAYLQFPLTGIERGEWVCAAWSSAEIASEVDTGRFRIAITVPHTRARNYLREVVGPTDAISAQNAQGHQIAACRTIIICIDAIRVGYVREIIEWVGVICRVRRAIAIAITTLSRWNPEFVSETVGGCDRPSGTPSKVFTGQRR